jgi:hypothetical protein
MPEAAAEADAISAGCMARSEFGAGCTLCTGWLGSAVPTGWLACGIAAPAGARVGAGKTEGKGCTDGFVCTVAKAIPAVAAGWSA